MDRTDLLSMLQSKRGWVVVYLSAPWCAPCKKAGPLIEARVAKLAESVVFLHLNVDTCADVYASLRAKKQVNGIPTLLAYKKNNHTLYADASCSGAEEANIDNFFSKLDLNEPV
jgi:thiol-disulfide isomerase/thioredoxin